LSPLEHLSVTMFGHFEGHIFHYIIFKLIFKL
jgi:hypothetical protein